MFPQILLVLENLSLNARLNLLEESSSEQSQNDLAMTNFFITETTGMIRDGLIPEIQEQFVNNLNAIFESENEIPDQHNMAQDIVGAAATGAIGLGLASKYRPAKIAVKKAYSDFKKSPANKSFKTLAKDTTKAAKFVESQVERAKNFASEKMKKPAK